MNDTNSNIRRWKHTPILKTLTGPEGEAIFNEIKNMKPAKPLKRATPEEMRKLIQIMHGNTKRK